MVIKERNTFSIGLLIAISSWALIFFTLVWGYVVYRLKSPAWLGDYLTFHTKNIAIINTLLISVSSWSLSVAYKKKNPVGAWSAFIMGMMFLGGQLYLWQVLMNQGLHWKSSIAGSFFFLLTGFHALHMLGALGAVLILCIRFGQWQGSLTSLGIKYFWDFLLVVWLVLFGLIFIIQ